MSDAFIERKKRLIFNGINNPKFPKYVYIEMNGQKILRFNHPHCLACKATDSECSSRILSAKHLGINFDHTKCTRYKD